MNETIQTILSQLGGIRRIAIMTGATIEYVNEFDIVTLKLPRHSKGKCKTFSIKYDYVTDLYNITTTSVKGTIMKALTGIYFDQLIPLFEAETGYYLTF